MSRVRSPSPAPSHLSTPRPDSRGGPSAARLVFTEFARYCLRLAGSTPATFSKSIILNVPAVAAGNVGRHRGFLLRNELGSACSRPMNTSAMTLAPIPDQPLAAREPGSPSGDLGFPEDVEPQRSAAIETDAELRQIRKAHCATARECAALRRRPVPTAPTTSRDGAGCVPPATPAGRHWQWRPAAAGTVASRASCRSACSACTSCDSGPMSPPTGRGRKALPKLKNVCQPMKRRGALKPPRRSFGSPAGCGDRRLFIEDEPEERGVRCRR